MNIPIKSKSEVLTPPTGYAFPFIDSSDMQLKAKLSDGIIINYSNLNEDIKTISLIDYTAFEVFAHDYTIAVGDCKELGGYVNFELTPLMAHEFTIRTDKNNGLDVVVDWGDGSYSDINTITPTGSEGNYSYGLEHTYSNTGKYIVKIFGKDYFGLIQKNSDVDPMSNYNNILCRALEYDLPVASHVGNFSSFCRGAKHLLNISINSINFNQNCRNMSNIFKNCINLLSARGFPLTNKIKVPQSYIFENCLSLLETNLQFIDGYYDLSRAAMGCASLNKDIADFFVYFNPTPGSTVAVTRMFFNCSKLYGTVPANKLWNNKEINWTTTTKAFEGCSDEIRSQVPVSWGGTADDSIIKKSIEERVENIESILRENSFLTP